MSRTPACDIDPVRIGKAGRITVCRDDPQDDPLSFEDERSIEIHVGGCRPYEDAYEASVAQQLLDGLLHQSGLPMQQTPFLRMLDQGKPCICQYAGHCLRERNKA